MKSESLREANGDHCAGLPFFPKGRDGLIFLTDRWGYAAPDPKSWGRWNSLTETDKQHLVSAMVDEDSFVIWSRKLGYGLLIEQEYLHLEGDDDAEFVRECWEFDPKDASHDDELSEAAVADRIGKRFARAGDPNGLQALVDAEDEIGAWIAAGPNMFACRVVAQAFVSLKAVRAAAYSRDKVLEKVVAAFRLAAWGERPAT